jgi:hypothetical protein
LKADAAALAVHGGAIDGGEALAKSSLPKVYA